MLECLFVVALWQFTKFINVKKGRPEFSLEGLGAADPQDKAGSLGRHRSRPPQLFGSAPVSLATRPQRDDTEIQQFRYHRAGLSWHVQSRGG